MNVRASSLAWAVALLTAAVSHAQTPTGGDLQRFTPEVTPIGGFGAGAGEVLDAGDWAAGLHLNYGLNPLVLRESDGRVASTIQHNLTGHLHGVFGLFDVGELALQLPLVLSVAGNDPRATGLGGFAAGDLRVQPRLRILSQWKDGIALLVSPTFTVPLGGAAQLAGEPSLSFQPEVGASWRGQETFVAGGLTLKLRPDREVFEGVVLGSEALLRLSGGMKVAERTEAILELNGGVALATAARGVLGNPLEILGGVRHRITDRWVFDLAIGAGLLSAPGTPDLRVIAGLNYGHGLEPRPTTTCVAHVPTGDEKRRADGVDTDGDAIDDACDLCAAVAENVNGLDDLDGCAEPDQDGDGLVDAQDQCPAAAGVKPSGCPDTDGDGLLDREDECVNEAGLRPTGCPDRDKDGLLDRDDKCPEKAEDPDAFEDGDGCPDLDNDKDGVPDDRDGCPDVAEDVDGFSDLDGCIDPDNDFDGIVDANDKCPNEKETINGVDDQDGCPDKGRTLVVVTKTKIEILDKVYFATDKDIIEKKSYGLLDQVALSILAHPEIELLRVEGHTDDQGGHAHNVDLSQRRAESVKRYLVGKGVVAARLDPKGFADDRPLVPNKDAKSRATNRRVEFNIVEKPPAAPTAP